MHPCIHACLHRAMIPLDNNVSEPSQLCLFGFCGRSRSCMEASLNKRQTSLVSKASNNSNYSKNSENGNNSKTNNNSNNSNNSTQQQLPATPAHLAREL